MHPQNVAHRVLGSTLTPFLYPCLDSAWLSCSSRFSHATGLKRSSTRRSLQRRHQSALHATAQGAQESQASENIDVNQFDHLNPSPRDFSSQLFTDACTLTISAGAGGHGCISFLREKYIANGPPNGGDGGTGGSVYIQAVKGETSLHKLARRGILKAGRGRNGQGSLKGGARGEDVLITVPVGTVVREISRHDPLVDEEARGRLDKGYGRDLEDDEGDEGVDQTPKWRRDKWLLYPGTLPRSFSTADFPALPRPRRSHLTALQPPAPLRLDLEKPMDTPLLLAAGAMGGLGNPHFVTKSIPRPKFATKGDSGMRIDIHLELKLLADVGLVGLPNAGKSTLLRALTRSRTRIGHWAFTTLTPNIGTVVLDPHTGRPSLLDKKDPIKNREPRANFTIADIPGLIEDAHLDHGLGISFLKHVERAAVLAFVLDLSAGEAVPALKSLWRELGEYEAARERELNADTERLASSPEGVVPAPSPFTSDVSPVMDALSSLEGEEQEQEQEQGVREGEGRERRGRRRRNSISGAPPPANEPTSSPLPLSPLALPSISSKPWLVVATKADLPDTQENFMALQEYLRRVQAGEEEHPSGKKNAWRKRLHSVPVSAINKEGVGGLPEMILGLLDG